MRNKGQAIIEFTLGVVCAVLFLILTCNLFVWFNHCLVSRQVNYEQSRQEAGSTNPGKEDFYTPSELNVFSPGGG